MSSARVEPANAPGLGKEAQQLKRYITHVRRERCGRNSMASISMPVEASLDAPLDESLLSSVCAAALGAAFTSVIDYCSSAHTIDEPHNNQHPRLDNKRNHHTLRNSRLCCRSR